MAALGWVRFCGGATAGPRPLGTAGAAGMTSFGTVMPAGGLADGARTELPGRGGNAEPDDLMVAGAATGGGAAEAEGATACAAPTAAGGAGAWGDKSLEGTPAKGSACIATKTGAGATTAAAVPLGGVAILAGAGAITGAGATDGASATAGAAGTTGAATGATEGAAT